MKKTTKLDKLKLKTETIRPLAPDDLQRAAGGLGGDPGGETDANDTQRPSCSCATCGNR